MMSFVIYVHRCISTYYNIMNKSLRKNNSCLIYGWADRPQEVQGGRTRSKE